MVRFGSELDRFRLAIQRDKSLSFGFEMPELKKKDIICYGRANGITGIEKFLGYNDSRLKVANFPSISLTHNFITVNVAVCLSDEDKVILDGRENPSHLQRATGALDVFRNLFNVKDHFAFYIEQHKKYDSAKGMGESAAFAGATAMALCNLMFRNTSTSFISSIARLVSGSGTRSVVNGVGLWQSYEGIDPEMNHAIRVRNDMGDFHIASFPTPNPIKTENVHGIATQSPFYEQWGKVKFQSLLNIIENHFDPELLAQSAMNDMLLMHSVLLARGISILNEKMFTLLKLAEQSEGSFFVTADTGPTPIILYRDPDMLSKAETIMGKAALKGDVVPHQTETETAFQKRARENLDKYA